MKVLAIASLLLLASCGGSGAPDIQVMDAWARETVAGQSGTAAYATITNRGSGGDRLLGVSAAPPIAAGSTVALKPGGAHIMISGLTAPLREGDDLKLTLRFERSGDRAVNFRVASATGTTGH